MHRLNAPSPEMIGRLEGGCIVTDDDDVSTWQFICQRCGARHGTRATYCAGCGAKWTVAAIGESLHHRKSRHVRAIPRVDNPPLPTGLPWLDKLLVGGLPSRCCWVLAGEPGGSKSTLAMMIAARWTRGRVLWISTEQHSSQVAEYADRIGLKDAWVYGNEPDTETTTVRALCAHASRHNAGLVIVDSVNSLESGASKKLERWSYKRGCAVICIAQLNAEGQVKGPGETRYEVTTVARMWKDPIDEDKRYIRLDKSRHGRDGVEIALRKLPNGTLWIDDGTRPEDV